MCPTAVAERTSIRWRHVRTPIGATAAGWSVGLGVTSLIIWSPYLVAGYKSPSVHLVLDSVDACVALLVAYLVHLRFVRHRRLQDRFLAQGLVLLAFAGFGVTYAVEAIDGVRDGTLDIWLPLTVRALGALYLVSAAFAGARLTRRHAWRPWTWVGPAIVVLTASLGLWAARDLLPVGLAETYRPSSDRPAPSSAHPLLLLGQGSAALGFLSASIAFAIQSARRDDELLRWLGPACALAGFARVNYALFPSLYTDWLYTGDVLRTGCYMLLLVGAVREMRQYWSAQAQVAVLEDRRRLARDLHDGVIQELVYIRSEGCALPAGLPSGDRIVAACDRGLDEARAAVQALGRPSDEPLGFVLHRTARELAERHHVRLEVDLDDSVTADPDQRHALTRITREAVSNAVRHGKAERVTVRLSHDADGRCLAIQDDGQGFDVADTVARSPGYGLVSMRDRARGLPGSLEIQAQRGHGSLVTARW
ncbi:MAG TPA: ATP-binding protein [Propionibacteriaceae bacterium]|nr:ATP-binding protein [Propionibacteriaceae bacterium]